MVYWWFFYTGRNTDKKYIARINSDGTLHPWNPNADNTVFALAISGGVVYAGGSFTSIGGQTRSCIAAIDASTGEIRE